MTKYAVIVAGGSGARMGTSVPKQFLLLGDRPLFCYSVDAFVAAFADIKIILVLPSNHLEKGEELVNQYQYKNVTIVEGGLTRFESVKNGLNRVEDPSIVFVHDAVRCLVGKNLIHRCYQQAVQKGSAIPAVAATDSTRLAEGELHEIIDRNKIRIVQTPQTFQSSILLGAFDQPYQETFTDEASVVEATGSKVFLIDGDYENIKVTRPIDLLIADKILQGRSAPL